MMHRHIGSSLPGFGLFGVAKYFHHDVLRTLPLGGVNCSRNQTPVGFSLHFKFPNLQA
jgi:hypothetical protein